MGRNWKRVYPNSVIEALRLCKDHALEKRHLSVERIAELMGVTADALYKWLSTGRMPVALLPGYENACGIDLVSRYLATSSGRLVIDMPTGKRPDADSLQELQMALHKAVGALLTHYNLGADPAETTAAVMAGLEQLAYHHHNIQQGAAPQLDLWEKQS
ncbi:hypothetical protein [Castellaniella caeni]|uniref:hypothetical protein n=1 Tax=Castellaniella caeni TaxID=266123 RepID=UPI000C9F0D2D|nr:hypothetical protein [Castellaniella caeni]